MLSKISAFFHHLFGVNFPEIVGSFSALLFFICVYTFIFFIIKRQDWSNEKKRKHSISVRNGLFFFLVLTLIFLWGGELKTLILSAAAIFAAFFVAFKEVLLSILGSLVSNKIFSVGDYIEYDGIKGKIIDKNFLNTRVLVLDTHQNKELVFPNLSYITSRIINLSKFGKYQSYIINISVDRISQMHDLSGKALEISKRVLAPYKDKYVQYFNQKKIEDIFFESPNVEPILTFELNDSKRLSFKIHYISHPLDQPEIEIKILNEYLSAVSLQDYCDIDKLGVTNGN